MQQQWDLNSMDCVYQDDENILNTKWTMKNNHGLFCFNYIRVHSGYGSTNERRRHIGVFNVFGSALSVYNLSSYWVRVCLLWVYVAIEHTVNSKWFQFKLTMKHYSNIQHSYCNYHYSQYLPVYSGRFINHSIHMQNSYPSLWKGHYHESGYTPYKNNACGNMSLWHVRNCFSVNMSSYMERMFILGISYIELRILTASWSETSAWYYADLISSLKFIKIHFDNI